MSTFIQLPVLSNGNSWAVINVKSGALVSQGPTPLDAVKDIDMTDDKVLSYITDGSKSYIF